MPHRLWRGKLPECFATVHLVDDTRFRGTRRFDLRKQPQRKRLYVLLLRRGQPEELIDWLDGALLVDLWDELEIPQVIRQAWDPVVGLAGNGPVERPWFGLPASPAASDAITGSRASSQHEPPPTHGDPRRH